MICWAASATATSASLRTVGHPSTGRLPSALFDLAEREQRGVVVPVGVVPAAQHPPPGRLDLRTRRSRWPLPARAAARMPVEQAGGLVGCPSAASRAASSVVCAQGPPAVDTGGPPVPRERPRCQLESIVPARRFAARGYAATCACNPLQLSRTAACVYEGERAPRCRSSCSFSGACSSRGWCRVGAAPPPTVAVAGSHSGRSHGRSLRLGAARPPPTPGRASAAACRRPRPSRRRAVRRRTRPRPRAAPTAPAATPGAPAPSAPPAAAPAPRCPSRSASSVSRSLIAPSSRWSAPRALPTSWRKALSASGSRWSARSTSSAWTLPAPSQIEFSGDSRSSRGMPGLLHVPVAAQALQRLAGHRRTPLGHPVLGRRHREPQERPLLLAVPAS